MVQKIRKGITVTYKKTVNSIAFIPAIIAVVFLLLSVLMIEFDFSEQGKSLKKNFRWLSLQDAETARTIASSIVGGVISLTVFSFSMVMILLGQVASQMSNRILNNLIGNRFQQIVLGFYIGTIVYSLFLLSTIRDIDSGIYVPAISAYVLIFFTIVDIFLFIYFLHYITQSVIYETIIHKISDNTIGSIKANCALQSEPANMPVEKTGYLISAYKSGVYQGFDRNGLLQLCSKQNLVISFLHPVGTFVLEHSPLFYLRSDSSLPEDLEKQLSSVINIHRGQNIDINYYYGFKHLTEVAIKALSPGINDPGTAAMSLQALGELLAFKMCHFMEANISDDDTVRIIITERTFEKMFEEFILPIWDYGKNDRLIQREMLNILQQLAEIRESTAIKSLLEKVEVSINRNKIELIS